MVVTKRGCSQSQWGFSRRGVSGACWVARVWEAKSAPGDTRLGTGAGHSSFPVLNIVYAKHAARGGEKKIN